MKELKHYVEQDISGVLLDEPTIKKRVCEMGEQISRDYMGKNMVAICILRGCVVFFSDLIREIKIPIELDFMAVSSYNHGAQSSGSVHIKYDLQDDIRGKHVLIVEDIIDTGTTLMHLKRMLEARQPASIKICCLLDKEERRVSHVDVDYIGFEIPDEFVVGYGLDYAGRYRNYREIGILKREIYE
jgi:hypoxanthine phosphoribosyltransferase